MAENWRPHYFHRSLARFVIEGRATGKQLGFGSYGSVEEIEVSGLMCAGKKIHDVLLDAAVVGVENFATKYVQECQLMSDLRHPNITMFMGVCFLPNHQLPLLVMEKLDSSLDDLLETVPNIPLALKRSILEDVSRGLLYLHKHTPQIIHRDLTAKNVLLMTTSLVAKITDFGNSRIINLQPGQLGRTLSRFPGTLVYMPPKALAASSRYGPSLDVFSFGHLGLFTLIQEFPGDLLQHTYPDPNNPRQLLARSEVDRRRKYFDRLERELRESAGYPLVILLEQCLTNAPRDRPTAEHLVLVLDGLKENIEGPYGGLARLDAVRQVMTTMALKGKSEEMIDKLSAKEEEIRQLKQQLEERHDLSGNRADPSTIQTEDGTLENSLVHMDLEAPGNTVDLDWSLEQKSNGDWVELGNGSYGKVYKGSCKKSGQQLAIKVVLDLTQRAAEVLEKEVRQLSNLDPHERIVTYFGACYADHPRYKEKCLYVFTEFMPGGSLSSCLEDRGAFPPELTWHYTRQIVEGVEYLHRCKVIHRDIKGSNIMCDTSDNIKLADFGSAKQICSETLDKDKTKYMYGTAPWAAPEVLRGEKAKTYSDIWSVAATVVEMLTGAMPYETEKFDNSMAIIFQVGGNNLNPLKSMKRGGHEEVLTTDIEAFLSMCFSVAEKRPSATYLLTLCK